MLSFSVADERRAPKLSFNLVVKLMNPVSPIEQTQKYTLARNPARISKFFTGAAMDHAHGRIPISFRELNIVDASSKSHRV
jgi:hypothetical protein